MLLMLNHGPAWKAEGQMSLPTVSETIASLLHFHWHTAMRFQKWGGAKWVQNTHTHTQTHTGNYL